MSPDDRAEYRFLIDLYSIVASASAREMVIDDVHHYTDGKIIFASKWYMVLIHAARIVSVRITFDPIEVYRTSSIL